MISNNNVDRNALSSDGECDKDELATKIENLGLEHNSKQEALLGKNAELETRQQLVMSATSTIEGFQKVLKQKQTIFEQRQTMVLDEKKVYARVSANLTSYQELRVAKDKELKAAQIALAALQAKEENLKASYGPVLMDMRRKGGAQKAQKILVEEVRASMNTAKTAFDNGAQLASATCAAASDLRKTATALASAHAASVSELKTATDKYTAAVTARDQRKTELSSAQQVLDAAIAKRINAARVRARECKESTDAEAKEVGAEKNYRDKQKVCAALETEEQQLIQVEAVAQMAFNAATREAAAASAAHSKAEKALATARAVHDGTSEALTDAKAVQTTALATETDACARAHTASELVIATTSELDQATVSLNEAKSKDFSAGNALTSASSAESLHCVAAGKAKCAMSRAKGALDAAKLRHDTAETRRKRQEAMVKLNLTALETATKDLEEAKSEVKLAEEAHSQARTVRNKAALKKAGTFVLLKGAKWKLSMAILVQGRAKAQYDTYVAQVECATRRYSNAQKDFEQAGSILAEAEKTKEICEVDLTSSKEPAKADELMDKLQVAYDALEAHLGVWKEKKSKMESVKAELDTKTEQMQSKKAIYEQKLAWTEDAIKARNAAKNKDVAAEQALAAAQKALNEAHAHMVSWQKILEARVSTYNSAGNEYSKSQQRLLDLISAENTAKRSYDQALNLWKTKVQDHGDKKSKCTDAIEERTAAEATKEDTATAYASASALVDGLRDRLHSETLTRNTAVSHCTASRDDRLASDAAVTLAEKLHSDAENALNKAKAAAESAAAAEGAAKDKEAKAKIALTKAISAARKKTEESIACDKEEEGLQSAWVNADAAAEKEQKQCTTACADLTAANDAVRDAQVAYDTAFSSFEAAVKLVTSTGTTKDRAAIAEAAAAGSAAAAESRAVTKEQLCLKFKTEADTLKSEWEAAQIDLNIQSEKLTKIAQAAQAAMTALTQLQETMKKTVQERGQANANELLAQEALDDIENCIENLQKDLADSEAELSRLQDGVDDAQEMVVKEEARIADEQADLTGYQNDVTRLQQEVQAAQSALASVAKQLSDAEATLEACPASSCTVHGVAHWDEDSVLPNVVDGATYTPQCERGFKPDFCDADDKCGLDATLMSCTDGKLSPPTYRCAPVLTGTLIVQILEGRKLIFGEEKYSYSDFRFHPIPSDPFVRVEACPGGANQTMDTSVHHDAYDAVWSEEAPMSFRIDDGACNTFRIAVRDERSDDNARCQWEAYDFIGATSKLEIVEGNALEKFMEYPNEEQHRRIVSASGGVVDFKYTWKPDDV